MALSPNFWQGKKVFLTGHTGFKGGWLSLWLTQLKAQVVGYALPPNTSPNLFTVANIAQDLQSTFGDIRDLPALQTAINNAQPDIVFHLAAQPLVRQSYAEPVDTYSTNIMGTVHLLEAVRQHNQQEGKIRAVVVVTTDKCYENREWLWGYRENEAMGGFDPYSSSKGCAELVSAAYRQSYFNPQNYPQHYCAIATARAGNVLGGGDWSDDRLIPDILRAFEKAEPAVIRNPHATRPWQHVLEPLSGYLMLAEKLFTDGAQFAEAWNFGPNEDDAKSVQWIVEQMVEQWKKIDKNASWQFDQSDHPHEANYLKLDISKAKARLKWQPRLSLQTALGLTIQWHQAYLANKKLKDICWSQIKSYYGETYG